MSVVLRVGLIVVSVLTLIFITRKVRNAQVRLEDSIFWFCVAGLLLILSIFPQTDTKLKELTQQLAIEKFERYCNNREMKNEDSSDQTDFLDNDKA